jgi:hypothetical protein
MRLKLISCEIFFREMCAAVARSPHRIDLELLPKGLHDIGQAGMSERLQATLDRIEPGYDSILLGYGLCNNGIAGLATRHTPLVVPRAHDCITLFFGSRQRYQEYFDRMPGTYFLTTGWLERGQDAGEMSQISIQHQMGMDASYAELVEKYGEDNAKYLYDTLCDHLRNYGQYTFIEMGVEPDDHFEREARTKAAERDWRFDKVRGDMGLIERLVNGPWDEEDFLTVPPGHRIVAHLHDDRIVRAEPM